MSPRRHHFIPTLLAVLLGTVGCADEPSGQPLAPAGGGGGGGNSCGAGSWASPNGDCVAVGVQDCAEMFVDDDGQCRPALDQCPLGTIPDFDVGCVPVGIPGCAQGFVSPADGLCRPTMDACGPDSFAVPLEGCVPIDGDVGCGSGTWGHLADGPDTIWVDPDSAGGDGSQGAPVSTIVEALGLVTLGGRIALAAGDYDEPVKLTKAVSLVGRCPSLVTLSGVQTTSYHDMPASVWVDQTTGASLSGVTISGPAIGIAATDAELVVTQVRVRDAELLAVLVSGAQAEVDIEYLLAEGTVEVVGELGFGRGFGMDNGAHVSVRHSAFVDNQDSGLFVMSADSELVVHDCLVEGTQPRLSDQGGGCGAIALEAGKLTISSSAFVANTEGGVRGSSNGDVALADGLVAGTMPSTLNPQQGYGVVLETGATGTISSTAITANGAIGVLANDATVSLTGNLVRDTAPSQEDGSQGRGISIEGGAVATLAGNTIVNNHEVGLYVVDPGSTMHAMGDWIAETQPRSSDERAGIGVAIAPYAEATLESVVVIANHTVGLYANDASVVLTASLVESTKPQASDGLFGMAVACDRASCTLSHALVRDSRVTGLLAFGSVVSLSDSVVDGVDEGAFEAGDPPLAYEGTGDGVLVARESQLQAARTVIQRCARSGLLADASSGSILDVHATGDRHGLVLQGTPKPDWTSPTNTFLGAESNVLTDGALEVPNPPPLPN